MIPNEFDKVLPSNNLVLKLLASIDEHITHFTTSGTFDNVLKKKKNENQHTTAFCVFMNHYLKENNMSLVFNSETPQKGSHTVDIGVFHTEGVLIFTIEAKILPIPIRNKKRHEYEYVYGKGGGIQRFKDAQHGVDVEDKNLTENGLIAYVKENDFTHWHKKINQWILDAGWHSSEQLQKIQINTTAKLKSTHPRIDGSQVVLHHFWVNV